MTRPAAVGIVLLMLAAVAEAQRRPRPRPRRPQPPTRAASKPRPRPILIDVHRPRDIAPLSGPLDGPVALDAHGHTVFLTQDGVLGQLHADGHLRWSLLVGPGGGAPALAADGTIYAAGRDGALYAVDHRGQLMWRRLLAGRPVRGVAVGRDRVAVALDTGKLELRTRDGRLAGRVVLGAAPSGPPVFLGGARFVVPLASGQVALVDRRRVAWRRTVGKGPVAPLGDALVAGTAGGSVARLSPQGRIEWRLAAGAPVTRAPARGADGTLFVAAGRVLLALTPTGKVAWRRDAGARIVAGPRVAEDGAVYVATEAAQLVSVNPDRRIALGAQPTRGLAVGRGEVWVALRDLTLRRIALR